MAKKDYAHKKSHQYKSPRLHIIKQKKRVAGKIIITVIGLSSLLGSILYWVFFSQLFIIRTVEVKNENGIAHLQLANLVHQMLMKKKWGIIPQNNYFSLFEKDLIAIPQKNSNIEPPISGLLVKKTWPDKLIIICQERYPSLQLITQSIQQETLTEFVASENSTTTQTSPEISQVERRYLLDKEGIVITNDTPNDKAVLKNLPRVILKLSSKDTIFKPQEQILDRTTIDKILRIYQLFFERQTTVGKISSLELKEGLWNEATIITQNGYKIYFSLTHSLQKQINHLDLTLTKIKEEEKPKVEYIDLRIEDRAYICCYLTIQ